jgi:hypothetical protein
MLEAALSRKAKELIASGAHGRSLVPRAGILRVNLGDL